MRWIEIFKKQGGIKLLLQYAKSGSLVTAICEFLLLGKSRTALEILRLSTQLKVKQKLWKKYANCLREFDRSYDSSLPHEASNKVWVCWFQGIENAPTLVQKCYQSLRDNLISYDIILITSQNLEQYVQFPEFILRKWKEGQITNTHMTDLLRVELLIRYGGMWVDATVFCTRKKAEIPDYFFNSDLFFYQCLKPGRDGQSSYISSWLISAKTNNKVLMATRQLCYEYWKKNNFMVDYFLLHDFFSIVLERYPEDWLRVVPMDNSAPHILLLRLFEPYDERIWTAIKNQTPFHKLSYKFEKGKDMAIGTYYDMLFGHTENEYEFKSND